MKTFEGFCLLSPNLLTGVKGIVRDAETGEAIQGATVEILGREHPATTTVMGEYWRMLMPNSYTIRVRTTRVLEDADA